MTKPLILIAASILMVGIQGCANTIKYGEATRTEAIKTEIGINELQAATDKLVGKMLTFPSVQSLTKSQRPTVAIDTISNHTQENLDTGIMTANLYEQLTASGQFRLSDPEKVKQGREEASNLLDYGATTDKAAKKIAGAASADLVLYGSLVDIIRIKPTNKEVYYRLSLHLLDAGSGKEVWSDEHEILKSQRKAIYGI